VATNGNDSTHSSWSTAYTNVQDALNAARSNDTVYLAGHTFRITNQLSWTGIASYVTIRGGYAATNDVDQPGSYDARRWPTVIARSGSNRFRVLAMTSITNCTMERVTVTGGFPANGDYGCGINISSCKSVLLSDCSIISNVFSVAADTSLFGGGLYANASVFTLSNCLVSGNTLSIPGNYGGASLAGAGIYQSGGTMTLVDSRIMLNSLIQTRNIPVGGGLYVSGGTCVLRDCLVQGNSSYRGPGTGLYLTGAACTTRLENCTIVHNIGEGVNRNNGVVSATNSILWGNLDDVTGTVSLTFCDIGTPDPFWTNGINGCFSSDPLFEYGYYLSTNSPCRGTGLGSASAWGLTQRTTQVDGTLDDGAQVDLGYHFPTGFDLSYADIYVAPPPAGNDGNSGTSTGNPFSTVGKAFSMTRDGTRIHVAPGVYTNGAESFPLALSSVTGVRLSGIGTNRDTTVINAAGANQRVCTLNRCYGMQVKDLTFTGGKPATAVNGCGLYITDCGDVTFSGCAIISNSFTTLGNLTVLGGGLYTESSSVTLSNCAVNLNALNVPNNYNCTLRGGGIHMAVAGSLEVLSSVIVSNKCLTQRTREGGGLYVGAGKCLLRNCLVVGNTNPGHTATAGLSGDGSGLYLAGAGAGICLENCIVVNNASQGVCRAAGTLTVTNSILWGNGDDVTGDVSVAYCDIQSTDLFWTNGVNGCLSIDPMFVWSATNNFRLDRGSPCINAGVNQGWMIGALDLDGNLRVRAGKVDMGAYECQSVGGTMFVIR
jgi:hypothetical protein